MSHQAMEYEKPKKSNRPVNHCHLVHHVEQEHSQLSKMTMILGEALMLELSTHPSQ